VSQTEIQPTAFAAAQMDITGATRGTVLVVIAGELDISNSHILRVRLLAALRDRHPAVLDVDMANVTFMDCSTVRALVSVHATAEKSGCRMRIVNPRSIVVRILEVLGLFGLFGSVPAREDEVVRAGEVVTNDGQRAE
jgi:anti-anti-sigma factor